MALAECELTAVQPKSDLFVVFKGPRFKYEVPQR